MPRIIIEGYRCNRCGHTWSPRNGTGYWDEKDPKYCRKCGTPYWNRPRTFKANPQRPGVAPGQTHIMIEGYQCERCGFRWSTPNGNGRWAEPDPKHCPKCRSTLWNKQRKRKLPVHRMARQWTPPPVHQPRTPRRPPR